MLIKGNVLPDEQNKIEISGLGITKIILLSVKLYKKKTAAAVFLCKVYKQGEL